MTPDYRALCAELANDLEEWIDGYLINDPADEHTAVSIERINRARALLAEPVAAWEPMPLPGDAEGLAEVFWAEPGAEGPTDEALANFTAWFCRNYPGPDTLIHRPEWHAPKVFRAASYAIDRYGPHPAPPAEGEVAELVEWLRLQRDDLHRFGVGPVIYRLFTRAAELLEQRYPAPVPVSELFQGWHMLSAIEPEPGARCDWVIMAPWGCDHGSGEWRDCDSVSPCNFFDVPVGWPVRYKGFASADGLMVSDPKLTAWRALPLPTPEATND